MRHKTTGKRRYRETQTGFVCVFKSKIKEKVRLLKMEHTLRKHRKT